MTEPPTPPRRGRPRKTSSEQIIKAAAEMLSENNDQSLSINGLARYMGIAPMGLYSYFEDVNDLRQSVANHILTDLNLRIKTDDEWQVQLTSWAKSVRKYFKKHPYLLDIIGAQTQIASGWLKQIAALTRILKKAGYKGNALSSATIWTSKVLVGAVNLELGEKKAGTAIKASNLDQLSKEDLQILSEMMPYFSTTTPSKEFDYCLARCISELSTSLKT